MQRGRAMPLPAAVRDVTARRAKAPHGAVAAVAAARLRQQAPSACCPPMRAGLASAAPAAGPYAALLPCGLLRWSAAATRRKRGTLCSASGAAQVRRGSCALFAVRQGRRLSGLSRRPGWAWPRAGRQAGVAAGVLGTGTQWQLRVWPCRPARHAHLCRAPPLSRLQVVPQQRYFLPPEDTILRLAVESGLDRGQVARFFERRLVPLPDPSVPVEPVLEPWDFGLSGAADEPDPEAEEMKAYLEKYERAAEELERRSWMDEFATVSDEEEARRTALHAPDITPDRHAATQDEQGKTAQSDGASDDGTDGGTESDEEDADSTSSEAETSEDDDDNEVRMRFAPAIARHRLRGPLLLLLSRCNFATHRRPRKPVQKATKRRMPLPSLPRRTTSRRSSG